MLSLLVFLHTVIATLLVVVTVMIGGSSNSVNELGGGGSLSNVNKMSSSSISKKIILLLAIAFMISSLSLSAMLYRNGLNKVSLVDKELVNQKKVIDQTEQQETRDLNK